MLSIQPLHRPILGLLKLTIAWKLILLVIAAASPGPGYDTSTDLLLSSRSLVSKLTRWDAIYFVQTAQRGYLFEQEWAFGWGFTRLISWCTKVLQTSAGNSGTPPVWLTALVGIIIANAAHLLAVLTLFHLTLALFPQGGKSFAFTAAYLHLISPAGLFLSAPCAESSCAYLTFTGLLVFAKSRPENSQPSVKHDVLVLVSGVLFGLSTTFRTNGMLSGLLLLEEASRLALGLVHDFQMPQVRRILFTGAGGLCVAAGFLLPQYIAYKDFCSDTQPGSVRPWCSRSFPSIYTFVQVHYWDNGFLRYWTLSNLPLFLLALPMLFITIKSSIWAVTSGPLQSPKASSPPNSTNVNSYQNPTPTSAHTASPLTTSHTHPILLNLAFTQLLLAFYTLTNAHVQIITRISSAYPVWIWYVATVVQDPKAKIGKIFVRFMVLYAVVQAGLYASFLPPA